MIRTPLVALPAMVLLLVMPGCLPASAPPIAAQDSALPAGGAAEGEPPAEPESDAAENEPPAEPEGDAAAGPPHPANRLAQETSPYLLMHAHNPVQWYPWGPEALEKARTEKKVIFLSIGYSSCHWCHVMERESFMDEEIAAFVNEHFVCIKVDREERPDIDSIYMTSLQVFQQLSGSGRGGGWPLSMFLTPDGLPFFGGTYFPARDGDRGNATGFLTIVQRVQEIWSSSSDKIESDAELITKYVKQELESRRPIAIKPLSDEVLVQAVKALESQYDADYGGFGYVPENPFRPKFPEPSNLFFLLDRVKRTQDESALKMLTGTLEQMARGGIRDHIGGGFHRYSVDRYWQIPHFEKMLYDNGQLASVYAEAHVLTGREDFKRVADQLLGFVIREMTAEGGGFYAALDADSEGEEGKFYRWEKAQIQETLSPEEFALFAPIYGIDQEPNFEEHYYAPQLARPLSQIAAERDLKEGELDAQLEPLRQKLFAARAVRPRPLTDSKILTSWNGLMIRGLADAGRLLKNDEYTAAATRAADFVLDKLVNEDGRLMRTYGQGQAKLNAYLDDYAFLIDGLIALFRTTGDRRWLEAADGLMAKQIELFWDDSAGGFFFTSDDHESLLARGREPIDGALPAGGSVSAANLLFLAQALDNADYRKKGGQTIQSVSGLIESAPAAVPRMLVAVAEWLATEPPE